MKHKLSVWIGSEDDFVIFIILRQCCVWRKSQIMQMKIIRLLSVIQKVFSSCEVK